MSKGGFKSLKVKSAGQQHFAVAPQVNVQRSVFDRTHGVKTTLDAGYLVPILVDEILPGDTLSLSMSAVARLATPIYPLMDNMALDFHFFFVPNRLVWTNWERFNGAQDNPDDSTDFLLPTITSPVSTGYAIGSLQHYFGIRAGVAGLETHNLVGRAYNLIWNEWYRDENLQDSVKVDKDDGPDDPVDYVLLKRGKRRDYFTSCLPWPQKGDSVDIPLTGNAPVTGLYFGGTAGSGGGTLYDTAGNSSYVPGINGATAYWARTATTGAINGTTNKPQIYADLSAVSAVTINQLRLATQMQRALEKDARGGTRYVERLLAHFGVQSPDFRLQRPEYLGGGSVDVQVTQVPQTSATVSGQTVKGSLSAFGTAVGSGIGFPTKSFVEHGYLIGLVSARADLNYQQGIPRHFTRSTIWDFYLPVMANLGEQAVLNKEIFAQGTSADDLPFGYQERWAEYRYKPNLITGKFSSDAAQPLDAWHLAQDFASLPELGSDFIVENPPMARVIAVNTEPHFLFDGYIRMRHARPMPVYSIPGYMDHL